MNFKGEVNKSSSFKQNYNKVSDGFSIIFIF